ncbi:3D domain-containing protein [Clostridium boliviensis]|uniref:3D domain-containing protein n=1 Tax=Clostridium boliviensis TaxID=318465 RepID=A0ABU4GP13_9CLOT|nr:3D domain-containing protein [Clostridium boliviensis]MDW2799351.1 3D domain-containing protein [Clostridium boliviensis]
MKISKKIQWFLGILLMITFLTTFPSAALAGQTAGIIDGADETSVRGWAWNSSDPSACEEVHVTITSQTTGTVVGELTASASKYRKDLADQGTGTGNYGFEISVPWSSYSDGSYLVEAYASGQKLSGSRVYGVGSYASAAGIRSLGIFKTTAYCPCRSCCGKWGGRTSTGTVATAGHTISVDPRVIPYGTRLMIGGVIYTAEDCGGGVKGNHIDIFFNTHGETRAYGTRNMEVFLVQ